MVIGKNLYYSRKKKTYRIVKLVKHEEEVLWVYVVLLGLDNILKNRKQFSMNDFIKKFKQV